MTSAEPGGRYDAEAKKLLKELQASGLILVVLDGIHGHGVQVATDESRSNLNVVALAMAKMLRKVADNLEKDAGGGVDA